LRTPVFLALAAGLLMVGVGRAASEPASCGAQTCLSRLSDAIEPSRKPPPTSRKPIGEKRCPGSLVEVSGTTSGEHSSTCAAANRALQFLERCGMAPKRPIHVAIQDEVHHPHSGLVFGLFDPAKEVVRIARQARLPKLIKQTPYAMLPLDAFYASLVVHEVVHALMHQYQSKRATSQAAYEYLAYALQIESMPPAVRATFLEPFNPAEFSSDILLNDFLLFLKPQYFAARAHTLFSRAGDRCTHIQALLKGELAFIVSTPMR
jgi:hypothetical protein